LKYVVIVAIAALAVATPALCLFAPVPARAAGNSLVGAARIPAAARDSLGETLGGFGSGMALVPGSWHKQGSRFTARLAMLPDRGWNTAGTTDYRARLQFFGLVLTPNDDAPGTETGLKLTFRKSLLLHDAEGQVTTGLDPTAVRPAANGLPDLPIAANGHVSLDDESLAFAPDGSFWIGEEYGPYIYHYDAMGKMIGAIRPPEAIIPRRQGQENFSAGETAKGEPQSGRQNNQGMEGMSIAPGGRLLFAVTQSALVQDLDPADSRASRRNVRLLEYDISGSPRLLHEYAVQLPLYNDGKRETVAAQSEMLAINDHQLLLLCRDSGAGFTGKRDASAYRIINLIDISGAGDIAGRYDGTGEAIAPGGALRSDIRPARLTPFLDMNDNAQLTRFGLHNGAPNNSRDLYEKWESMALAPDGDFLLVGSDNDFITQHGMMAGKAYADASGADVDTLVLAYRVTLPPAAGR
jgi:hypothetical protein